MGVVHARVQTDFINFFFRQDIPIVFKYMYIKERMGLQSIHNFYHKCNNSYMFWLCTCSHNQAEYRTLNKKTIKIQYNTKDEIMSPLLYCIVFL